MAKKKATEEQPTKQSKLYDGDSGLYLRWMKEIKHVLESKQQKSFEQIGERIVRKYKNAAQLESVNSKPREASVTFNVLWSNVQVMKPALYSRMPKVVVERRFKDSDPIGRLASLVAERATSFSLSTQQDRFNYAVKAAVEDRLLPGRGQVWLYYTADFEPAQASMPEDVDGDSSEDGDDNDAPIAPEVVKPNSEKICIEPVFWKDYIESIARNPYEVRWRAKRVYKTRAECIKDFGDDIGRKVALSHNRADGKKISAEDEEFLGQAEIWVIADLTSKKLIWISEGYPHGPLMQKDDPYKLDDFFPCPIPLVATTTSDSTYPTPDYIIYEKLADELDMTMKRLKAMVECVRLVGATSSAFNKDVKNMLTLGDGQLWPMNNWQQYVEKGGFKGVIDWLPFDNCVAAIPVLSTRVQELLSAIFEITGIPDIARGVTDPNETLGAQNKKLRSMGTKAEEKSREVQAFCRQILSKMAEMIFEPGLFSDETIYLMCGVAQMSQEDQQNFPAALELLRNDRLRTFRVDIETDSTIALDEDGEKESRMEYMQAMSSLVSTVKDISEYRPELLKPVVESALFVARSFRAGRQVEGAWTQALESIEDNDKAAAEEAANNPPPPDYEMLKAQTEQAKNQTEQMKVEIMGAELQMKQQSEQFKQQFEPWIRTQELEQKNQKMQMDFQLETQKIQIDGLKVQTDAQIKETEAELEAFKTQFMQQMEAARLEIEKYRVINSEGEKQLEERRLAQEQQIELVRMAHEEKLADKQAAAIQTKSTKTKRGKRVHRVIRTTDGFVGESDDADDNSEA